MLSCRDVEVAYDQVQVLFGVDLDVYEGEVVALLGTNGAGKSTLLKAISGLVEPLAGQITFEGTDIAGCGPEESTRRGIVQVPGGKAVFPTLTVAEHLRAAGWMYRREQSYLREASEHVLSTFPRLRERINQLAGDLSGGEQQMLAVGMALIAKPKLLVIDELSLGLAPAIVQQLIEVLSELRASGVTMVVVEQSVEVALGFAERAYFMEKGEIRFEGATTELIKRNDIVRSVFLEGATGREADQPASARAERVKATSAEAEPSSVVLQTEGLHKRFGGIVAVDGVDLTLREGEIVGIIGPNGAGKTTVFDLVSGFIVPTDGTIRLGGTDITGVSPDARARAGLGRMFQDARLFGSLTVAENLALALDRHLWAHDHLAAGLALPGILMLERDVAWTVADLVELMSLSAFRDKTVRELSTGSRRIVELAMAIAHDPDVLLLDEPSSGIAQRETEALGPLLLRIQQETGCSMLVIEHDMPLITSISDQIVALHLGSVLTVGSPADVIKDARVISAYLGDRDPGGEQ